MTAYYNEFDPKAAAWLRELIKRGLIADGEVDERSIVDVAADDLAGYAQCHFFAGIGGWSYALRLAGWPDDRPVWTASLPCQPFSAAGKQLGTDDSRHLWPVFKPLAEKCRPARIFGEQVASKPGREWLAGVRADLETLGYAVGAADLCAASVGAPHIRQRLYWVADAESQHDRSGHTWASGRAEFADGCATGRFAHANGCEPGDGKVQRSGEHGQLGAGYQTDGLGKPEGQQARLPGFAWRQSDAIDCLDGKSRRVESGTFPLAHGIPARMGRLRGYGNAIVPQVAAEFVRAAA